MPVLLARFGEVHFGKAGGCQIGSSDDSGERPVQHITGVMEAFGATVKVVKGKIQAIANVLYPTVIDIHQFSYEKNEVIGPLTSGATKTAILLAMGVSSGKTIILNPFLKSETINLLVFVEEIGFKVSYDKHSIEIERNIINKEVKHHIISDPSEIMTYISLAVYHHISITLNNITMQQTESILEPEFSLLRKLGVKFKIRKNTITVYPSKAILACNVDITPVGVCTDHHPFILAILLLAPGTSKITEYVWHERFQYIPEMRKLNINLIQKDNSVIINSQSPEFTDDILLGLDLRASALLLIVSLKTPGITKIKNFSHLYRGYEELFSKLQRLGALIEVSEDIEEQCIYA